MPRLASFWRTGGSASARRTSAEIFFTTSAGVPAGAQTPNQSGESAFATPPSPVVGTSGSCELRFGVLTASGRSLPLRMFAIAAEIGAQ